jgi:hypothetical protein
VKYLVILVHTLKLGLALALMLATALVELLGIGVLAGNLPASWGRLGQLGFVLVGIPASFLVALALHEVGHLLAGAAAGFRPLLAHVGPITLKRVDGSWRLVWDRRQSWLLARALVANRPAGRGPLLTLAMGGCIANLAGALALAVLAVFTPSLGGSVAGLAALNCLVTGLVNLAPLRLLGCDSDGLCVLRLLWQRQARPFNWQPWPSVL